MYWKSKPIAYCVLRIAYCVLRIAYCAGEFGSNRNPIIWLSIEENRGSYGRGSYGRELPLQILLILDPRFFLFLQNFMSNENLI